MSTGNVSENPGSFRDTVASIEKDGRRHWIYPQKPSGIYYRARTILSIFLLGFLFSAPFVSVNGRPLMLLNVLERKFVILGVSFWPQDFYLIVLGFLSFLLSFVLFTSIFGRVWCGWLCPQTVFLEMLFRKIEYAIDGNHIQQKNLDNAPWSVRKIFKRALKHGIFFSLSFIIANVFLCYIIGKEELFRIISDPPSQHIAGLGAISIFSFLFYGVFAWFREQACVVVCPYGRYQSALVDEDTIGITYDFVRGEPRGKFSKQDKIAQQGGTAGSGEKRGDCIDCRQCISVCPTGIDIRNGIQLECVNCTACMDACDNIMEKIGKPKGLIRFTSYNAVKHGTGWKITPRIIAYAVVLTIVFSLFGFLFLTRPDMEVLILRQPGTLFQPLGNGRYANFYTIETVNKTFRDIPVEIRVTEPAQGSVTLLGPVSPLKAQSNGGGRFFLALDGKNLSASQTAIKFGIYSRGKLLKEVSSSFVGPEKH